MVIKFVLVHSKEVQVHGHMVTILLSSVVEMPDLLNFSVVIYKNFIIFCVISY